MDMDTALSGGVDAMLATSVSVVQGPAVAAVALYFMGRGLNMGGGRARPFDPVADVARVFVLLALTLRIDLLNTWVRDVFFTGLPGVLMASYATQASAVSIGSTSAAAAAFNAVWAQTNIVVAQAHAQSMFGGLDVAVLVAEISQLVAGFFLILMAVTYVVGKLLLGMAVVFSPYVFALSIHPFFEGLLQRWVGLVLGYVGMLASVVIMLQLVLSGNQTYLDRIIEAQRAYEAAAAAMPWYNVPGRVGAANAAMATTLSNVVGMALWVAAGAVATAAVGTISFFLFGGLMPQTQPSARTLAHMAREMMRVLPSSRNGPGVSGGVGGPNYSLSLSRPQLSSTAPVLTALPSGRGTPVNALPPPPPQPLHIRGGAT